MMTHYELAEKYPEHIFFGDEFKFAKEQLGEQRFQKHYTTVFGKPVLNFAKTIVFNLPCTCYCNCEYCIDYTLRKSKKITPEAYLEKAREVLKSFPDIKHITITGGTLPSKYWNKLIEDILMYQPDASLTWNTNGAHIDETYNIEPLKHINLHRQSIHDNINNQLFHTKIQLLKLNEAKKLFGDKLSIRAVMNDCFSLDEYASLGLSLFLNRQIPGTEYTNCLCDTVIEKINISNDDNRRRNNYLDGEYKNLPVRIGLGDDMGVLSHIPGRYPTWLNVVILHRSGTISGSWYEDDKLLQKI